jgi:uncharacterized membrane protein HdeD (DUF308 family)
MHLLSALGALLIVLGVVDLFVQFTTRVGAIPMIVIGVVLLVVGGFTSGGPWYRGGGPVV